MVKVAYQSRIVVDKYFVMWLLTQRQEFKKEIFRKLMFIKSTSLHHPRKHNIILESDFKDTAFIKFLADNMKEEDNIVGIVKPCEIPLFLKGETDPISRYIRYSIYLTNEKPYRAVIFTTEDKIKEYKENPHIQGVFTSVNVIPEKEAVVLINSFFRSFEIERLRQH